MIFCNGKIISCAIFAMKTLKSKEDEVLYYFVNRATNAAAESLNSKMKEFRSELRGVRDLPFYLFRCSRIFGQQPCLSSTDNIGRANFSSVFLDYFEVCLREHSGLCDRKQASKQAKRQATLKRISQNKIAQVIFYHCFKPKIRNL